MIWTIPKAKVEYGDFQTPIELAELICHKLIELGVNPDAIIEPTCGVGNFIDASSRLFRSTDKILGVEINSQ
jgi:type I restriction-modification system DNA methylase subunit